MSVYDTDSFRYVQETVDRLLRGPIPPPLPDVTALHEAAIHVDYELPEEGLGSDAVADHLLQDIIPGLNGSSLSPNYYGFVTGGITPAARLADNIVTLFDQNVSVHLPEETIATVVEHHALIMLLTLLELVPVNWPTRTLTTGATASNILGLACGRQYVVEKALESAGLKPRQGEGLLPSCIRAGIHKFQILTTLPHSSLGKAANIVGIGSEAIVDVSVDDNKFLAFDLSKLESHLSTPGTVSIVVISCGEVNTGLFATNSTEEVQAIRELCDRYNAWLHVDGAFGIMTRVLPREYNLVRRGGEGLQVADSIGGDGHKLLNVPYDCGFFFSSHPDVPGRVFQNTNAAYLDTTSVDSIPSPLNIRLENSARFRGLPLYATLIAYGRTGYAQMVARMVDLARKIATYIRDSCPKLELLPREVKIEQMYICVLFCAKDDELNEKLVDKIKETRKVYGSGTKWQGRAAVRFAIAKWDVDVARDFEIVREVLDSVVRE